MKKLLLILAFAAFAVNASAQRAIGRSSAFWSAAKPDRAVILGIRAGVNISNVSVSEGSGFDSKVGFNVGVSADFPIVESFYFQSGLYFSMKGAQNTYEDYYDDDVVKESWNPYYLEIPLLASYRFNFSERTQLQINTGPYLAVGLGGKFKETFKEYPEDNDSWSFFGKDSNIKRFDFGWQVGAGITISRIYVGFNYGFGFVNMLKESNDYSWKNSVFSVNVGFNF